MQKIRISTQKGMILVVEVNDILNLREDDKVTFVNLVEEENE